MPLLSTIGAAAARAFGFLRSLISGYNVANSLRFNLGSADYLNRTLGTSTSRRIYTMSTWVKRSVIGTYAHMYAFGPNPGDFNYLRFNNSQQLNVGLNGDTYILTTNALYRDVSAWYHVVCAIDTTQATASNRVKLYVNGEQITSFATASYPTQNFDTNFTSGITMRIGSSTWGTNEIIDGYLAETYIIDGQALTPSSFGETDTDTGIWKPKSYTGSFGTNGFYLKFGNSAALGTDSSGNGNNFTVNNLTSVDQSTDTPTNNFCTGNPLDNSGCVFTEGNLAVAGNASSDWNISRSTFGVSSGKWYWEVKPTSLTGAVLALSISTQNAPLNALPGQDQNFGVTYYPDGTKFLESCSSGISYGASYTTSDIIGVALNMDNGSVTFYKNGVSQGVASTSLLTYGDTWFPTAGGYFANDAQTYNFGSPPFTIASGNADANGYGNFEYAVPSGYYALNTKNLAQYG